ncbi:glycosyltransferase family 4 protein [Aliikangiella coralliicola]|uniref:Glycosyltransferase n=1 Tax=Aliikangiella coralliicola TaxID=2592383 RepID=A0A545UJ57_9GAMM|nr:glycosyltransferase [Aliikangiella coralliicola]TQV89498.1 glycosyltransferase [Aliikangiella coralliicola]
MAESKKHLILVNYAYQSEINNPKILLENYFMLPAWANACRKKDVKVSVFQRFKTDEQLESNDVQYFFVSDTLPPRLSFYHCALSFNRRIINYARQVLFSDTQPLSALEATSPEHQVAIHINGLIFPMSVLHLTHSLNEGVRYFVQHHAERPLQKLPHLFNRTANRKVTRFFFTTKSHAEPWIKVKAMSSSKITELMECSSTLIPRDKNKSKHKLGFAGKPLLLWTGNLNHNKDPLTILAGFEQFLIDFPDAQLMMLFRSKELLTQVKKKMESNSKLENAVSLIGQVPYSEIADYYSAADIFVQGSAREGSGIAVLDALVCGAVPVITQIPSFKVLTRNGTVGTLWSRGSEDEFLQSLRAVMSKNLPAQQIDCQKLFKNNWSIDVLVRQALEHYFGTIETLREQ